MLGLLEFFWTAGPGAQGASLTTTAIGASADYIKYLTTQPLLTDRLGDPNFLEFSLAPIDNAFVKLARGNYITLSSKTQGVWYTGYIQNDPAIEKLGTQIVAGIPTEVFGYKYQASDDSYIISLKPIGLLPPFVNTNQGAVLKQLIALLAPTVTFDVTGITPGLPIASLVIDPIKVFADVVKEFCDAGNCRFTARAGKLAFVPQDTTPCTLVIDGNDQHFTSADLTLTRANAAIINDAIVLGDVEQNNYMTEYFIGDGVTARFPLISSCYGVDSTLLQVDDFTTSQIDSSKWVVFDKPQNYLQVYNGYLNVLGGPNDNSYSVHLDSANQYPLFGNLRITHGEYDFVSASDGIVCGLWVGAAGSTFANCFYGIRATKSGANTIISPMVRGVTDNTQQLTISASPTAGQINYSHRLIIRTIYSFQYANRTTQAYSYTDAAGVVHTLNAQSIADTGACQTFISEVDPATGNVVAQYQWVSQNMTLGSSELYATYVPAVSNDLNCTFTGITISSPMQVGLGICPAFRPKFPYQAGLFVHPTNLNGHYYKVITAGTSSSIEPTWTTGTGSVVTDTNGVRYQEIGTVPQFNKQLVGPNEIDSFDNMTPVATVVDGNQGWNSRSSLLGTGTYNFGNPALEFFTDILTNNQGIPWKGDLLKVTYNRAAVAMARAQDRTSIVTEAAAWGDDGLRSIVRRDISPAPRTSTEALMAAQAIIGDLSRQHWDGSYKGTSRYSFTGQPVSGTMLKFQNMPAQYPSSLTSEVVQEVRSTWVSVSPVDTFLYDLTFGTKDTLRQFVGEFTKQVDRFQQDTTDLPPAIDITGVATAFAPTPTTITLTGWDSANFNLSIPQAPPVGGGYEIRYTDESWGCDPGKNLISRGTSQTFSTPRNFRGKVVFVRAFDARNQCIFSEDFTNAAWAKSANVTVANSTLFNPDDNQSQVSTATTTAITQTLTQATSQPSALKQAVFSCSIKAPVGKTVTMILKDGGGTTVATGVVTGTGNWVRGAVTGTAGAAGGNFSLVLTLNQVTAYQVSQASLEVGTAVETQYCKTLATPYGALSQYAAGVHIQFPLIPPPFVAATLNLADVTAPVITFVDPTIMLDVWGYEIRDPPNVGVIFHQDLINTQSNNLSYNGSFTLAGNTRRAINLHMYTYNLLGEFSTDFNFTPTIPTPAITNLLVSDDTKCINWTPANNKVLNPGFETNTGHTVGALVGPGVGVVVVDNWTSVLDDGNVFVFALDNVPHTGSQNLFIRLLAGVTIPNGSTRTGAVGTPIVAVTPGSQYYLGGWLRWNEDALLPTGVTGSVFFQLRWLDATGAFISENDAGVNAPIGYTYVSTIATVPDTATQMQVCCTAQIVNASGASFVTGTSLYMEARFDDVFMTNGALPSATVKVDPISVRMLRPGISVVTDSPFYQLSDGDYFNLRFIEIIPFDGLGAGTPQITTHSYIPPGVVEFNNNEVVSVFAPPDPNTDPTVPGPVSGWSSDYIHQSWKNYGLNDERYN